MRQLILFATKSVSIRFLGLAALLLLNFRPAETPYFSIRNTTVSASGKIEIQMLLHRVPENTDTLRCRIKAGDIVLEPVIKVKDLKIINSEKNIRQYTWSGLIPVGFVYVSVEDKNHCPFGKEKKEYIVPRINNMHSFKKSEGATDTEVQSVRTGLFDLNLDCPPVAKRVFVVVMDSKKGTVVQQYLGPPVPKIQLTTIPEDFHVMAKAYDEKDQYQDFSFSLKERIKPPVPAQSKKE